jgi:hypothetical protein
VTAKFCKTEVWKKLWYWDKEALTWEELNIKLLLAKNSMQLTAWHLMAEDGNTDTLVKSWVWAKDTVTWEK